MLLVRKLKNNDIINVNKHFRGKVENNEKIKYSNTLLLLILYSRYFISQTRYDLSL